MTIESTSVKFYSGIRAPNPVLDMALEGRAAATALLSDVVDQF
jgi:hypothetical protein